MRQVPHSSFGERSWHRDFVSPGDRPLSINTIIMLNEMREERGPTRVVPGTHRGEQDGSRDQRKQPLPGEVAVYAAPGDAVFINSAIWLEMSLMGEHVAWNCSRCADTVFETTHEGHR
jgi:ectoine hydroxylase-related dioxygenase (phytanoyl-CoA dioxygenase family)